MTRRLRPGEIDDSIDQNREVYTNEEEWSCDENDFEDESEDNNNPYRERSLSRRFQKIAVLKRGSQGVVYLARERNSSKNQNNSEGGKTVAIKRMFNDIREENMRGVSESVIREIGLLKSISQKGLANNKNNNNNIIRFLDVVYTFVGSATSSSSSCQQPEICLVLEICDGDAGSLVASAAVQQQLEHNHHHNNPCNNNNNNSHGSSSSLVTPLHLILHIMKGALQGLKFLHEPQQNNNNNNNNNNKFIILHRDIKPSNILIRKDVEGSIALADFGSARLIDARENGKTAKTKNKHDNNNNEHDHLQHHHLHSPGGRRTTLSYRAPEILLGQRNYTTAADVWGMGVVFVELLKGSYMFHPQSEMQMLTQLFSICGYPDESVWPESKKFPLLQAFSFTNPHNQNNQHQQQKHQSVGEDSAAENYENTNTSDRVTPEMVLRKHLEFWFQRRHQQDGQEEKNRKQANEELVVDLIIKMLSLNPSNRPSAAECLEHELFSSSSSSSMATIAGWRELRNKKNEMLRNLQQQQQQIHKSSSAPPKMQQMLSMSNNDEDDDEDDVVPRLPINNSHNGNRFGVPTMMQLGMDEDDE